ncbi:MAG: TIGR03067 domain-containing protein [Pirellulales bacterium]|nr:TIGR03067 domain-containing protein [Pirellulales bacterium]
MIFENQGTIRSCCEMHSEMNKGNAMKYSDFAHWFFVCLVLTVSAARGFAEPADQVNQQEGNKEEKIQQKAREEYAGLWRIETIASKGDTTEPDKRIAIESKTDGTWILFIDDKELSRGTNSFAPLRDPKEIDISITGGEGQGKVLQGIYDIEESIQRLCFRGGGGPRPDSFESFYGDESVVVTFVRE